MRKLPSALSRMRFGWKHLIFRSSDRCDFCGKVQTKGSLLLLPLGDYQPTTPPHYRAMKRRILKNRKVHEGAAQASQPDQQTEGGAQPTEFHSGEVSTYQQKSARVASGLAWPPA